MSLVRFQISVVIKIIKNVASLLQYFERHCLI